MKTNKGTAPFFLAFHMGSKQVAKYTPWSFYFLLKKPTVSIGQRPADRGNSVKRNISPLPEIKR
jgi:hypothetical protein